jgi:hypothetical protein
VGVGDADGGDADDGHSDPVHLRQLGSGWVLVLVVGLQAVSGWRFWRRRLMTRLDALRLLLAKQDAPARHEWITRTLHLLASVTRRAA